MLRSAIERRTPAAGGSSGVAPLAAQLRRSDTTTERPSARSDSRRNVMPPLWASKAVTRQPAVGVNRHGTYVAVGTACATTASRMSPVQAGSAVDRELAQDGNASTQPTTTTTVRFTAAPPGWRKR